MQRFSSERRRLNAMVERAPLDLVNILIIFGMLVMPLTYYPILQTATDRNVMGRHINSRLVTILGTIFLALIVAAAVAAVPLSWLTHGGKP